MRCLIVNRGEIALRAIQSCKELGLTSVWLANAEELQSEAALQADETISVPVTSGSNVYMDLSSIEKAIEVKKINLVYAGYGFLSENSSLAGICEKLGVQFVGPKSAVLKVCSHKSSMQEKVKTYGIETLRLDSNQIDSYQDSILVKASKGGGGRGHCLVEPSQDLQKAIAETKELSQKLFASDEVHFERYLKHIRHVEAQFAKTSNQSAVLLGTRDCSVQRNYQKVIEEGEIETEILRSVQKSFPQFQKLLDDVGYEGLGTIEFVWDLQTKLLYFIEMNCRIQVEHPVTEMLISQNLVTCQFRIAMNHQVNWKTISQGHSIQCRLYGEDPIENFRPSPLKIEYLKYDTPPFVRWDWSFRQGDCLSLNFDPMIAKLIVWADTRQEAISKSILALKSLVLHGPKTNQELLIGILESQSFVKKIHDTNWLQSSFLPDWKTSYLNRKDKSISKDLFSKEPLESSSSKKDWKTLHKLKKNQK